MSSSSLTIINNTSETTFFYQKPCSNKVKPGQYNTNWDTYLISAGDTNNSKIKSCSTQKNLLWRFFDNQTSGSESLFYMGLDLSAGTWSINDNQGEFFNKRYSFDFDSGALTLTINDSNNVILIYRGIGIFFITLVIATIIYAIVKKYT